MIALLMMTLAGSPAAAAEHPDDVADVALAGAAFSRGVHGPVSDAPWWPGLGDAALDALLNQAFVDNADLRAAWARVEQSRGRQLQALSALSPTVSFDASVTMSPTDSVGFGFNIPEIPGGEDEGDDPEVYYSSNVFLKGQWVLDVFGKSAFSASASRYDALASEGNTQAQRLAVASQVAGAWYDVVAARERVDIVEDQLRLGEELLELVTLRYEGGEATALDVLQQRQQLSSAKVQLPAVRLQRESAEQRLALLTGRTPLELQSTLPADGALPELGDPPAVGTPDDLLANRPDLQASYASARAARSRRVSAALGYTPTVSLSGQVGQQGNYGISDPTDEWQTLDTWSVTGAISVPLFTGARTTGALKDARYGETAALETLRAAALGAVQEVEGSLLQDAQMAEQRAAWDENAEAARQSFEESRARYIEGLTTYVNVLNALNAAQAAELNALQAHRDQISARIQLHTALGGGWAMVGEGE